MAEVNKLYMACMQYTHACRLEVVSVARLKLTLRALYCKRSGPTRQFGSGYVRLG